MNGNPQSDTIHELYFPPWCARNPCDLPGRQQLPRWEAKRKIYFLPHYPPFPKREISLNKLNSLKTEHFCRPSFRLIYTVIGLEEKRRDTVMYHKLAFMSSKNRLKAANSWYYFYVLRFTFLKPFVIPHHQLRVQLFHGFQNNTDYDQESRAAQSQSLDAG